ncbi:MAG: hypothetical protein FWG32_06555 [Oscillospiraceae bacterium]|nr:hypothetical protein [Oscillospiraceae bacterium]
MGKKYKGAVKALVTIVEHGSGDNISAFFNKKFPHAGFLTMGVGTAGSELMNVLGLDSADKDVILSVVNASVLPAMLSELSGKKFIKSAGKGIAFSLRINGISGLLQNALTANEDGVAPEGEETMDINDNFSLILAVTEPGYTDDIMELAKEAGATGGTVLYARGIGHDGPGKFLGISIQSDKEIICILAPVESRLEIMNAIKDKFGLRAKNEAGALVLSLPVEDMIQVS